MRVLIDYRPALRDRSGVGEYTHQLVTSLLSCYPPSASQRRARADHLFELLEGSSPDTPELRGASAIDRRVPVSVLNFAWHRLEWPPDRNPDGPSISTSRIPRIRCSCRRAHAAQVITIHDLDFLAHPGTDPRGNPARLSGSRARSRAPRRRILVPSQFTAGEVERQLGVARRSASRSVRRARRTGRLATDAASERLHPVLRHARAKEERRRPARRVRAVDRAIARSAEAGHHVSGDALPELVLAGKATEEARPWLERIDSCRRSPDASRHIGYVEPADRQALYAGARLLVMPSFEEGFGIPVLEAMTFGVPVVASNRGSLPEVLGDAGPLVDPDDPAADRRRDRPPPRRRGLRGGLRRKGRPARAASSTGTARHGWSTTRIVQAVETRQPAAARAR